MRRAAVGAARRRGSREGPGRAAGWIGGRSRERPPVPRYRFRRLWRSFRISAFSRAYIAEVKNSRKAAGVAAIRIPRDRAFAARERSIREGVEIYEVVWQNTVKLAAELGVPIPAVTGVIADASVSGPICARGRSGDRFPPRSAKEKRQIGT